MFWVFFFYTYQHFLVIHLDCVILALHTACKNSLSSYQIMCLRNSRDFKSGQTVIKTQDLLVDSEWEASTSLKGCGGQPPHRMVHLAASPARVTAGKLPSFHPCHLFWPLPGLISVLPRQQMHTVPGQTAQESSQSTHSSKLSWVLY